MATKGRIEILKKEKPEDVWCIHLMLNEEPYNIKTEIRKLKQWQIYLAGKWYNAKEDVLKEIIRAFREYKLNRIMNESKFTG